MISNLSIIANDFTVHAINFSSNLRSFILISTNKSWRKTLNVIFVYCLSGIEMMEKETFSSKFYASAIMSLIKSSLTKRKSFLRSLLFFFLVASSIISNNKWLRGMCLMVADESIWNEWTNRTKISLTKCFLAIHSSLARKKTRRKRRKLC